eukprot:g4897.t1
MARRPELVKAFVSMMAQVNLGGALSPGLRQMIAYMASRSAGCLYCQAHTHHGAENADDLDAKKLAQIWEYETSDLFSEAERAALTVAQLSAQVPNGVSDADFEALKPHFDEDQIVDIVAVISAFGFLNRWNDTLATPLEEGTGDVYAQAIRNCAARMEGENPLAAAEALQDELSRLDKASKRGAVVPRHVLVIGGAGYVGSVMVRELLKRGYQTRVLDNFLYSNSLSLEGLYDEPGFSLVMGDLRDEAVLDLALDGVTDVVLLASLVGDPISKKFPDLTRSVNQAGSETVFKALEGRGIHKFVFTSTCSNYGMRDSDEPADETSDLKPLSIYAETKVGFEQFLLEQGKKSETIPTVLRISTAFGLSHRMRFDLTVNEFTAALAKGEALDVYDKDTWRPYCHVRDIAGAVIRVLEAPEEKVRGEVFNVGADENNYTKAMIIDEILSHIDGKVSFVEKGSDPRNYRVSFAKIKNELGFEPRHSVKAFNITDWSAKKRSIIELYGEEVGDAPFPRSLEIVDAKEKVRGAEAGYVAAEAFMLLKEVPIVDAGGVLTGLETLSRIVQDDRSDNWVVIMAGGLGTRLRPLTENLPKPLIPVGGKPVLESIIERLAEQGFKRIFLSVNYQAEKVEAYFGDGHEWGVDISYLEESKRLGTAGALTLLPETPSAPFLVMNADLVTAINFRRLLDFHVDQVADATMGVREYRFQVPYGVIEMSGNQITEINEKPTQNYFVNGGVYALSPAVLHHVPDGEMYDMPTLFDQVISEGGLASAFPIHEYWIDIGQLDDLQQAQEEFGKVFGAKEPV